MAKRPIHRLLRRFWCVLPSDFSKIPRTACHNGTIAHISKCVTVFPAPDAEIAFKTNRMASRKIRDEVMMMTIAVNSDPAQRAIYELRNENVKYAQSIEELQKKKDALGRRTKANADEFDKLTRQIKDNHQAIAVNKDRMEELRRALDVNQMSMNQLRKEAALLKRQLGEMVPGSNIAKQKELEERLRSVNARMKEVDMSARGTSNSFRSLADRFNHYSGIVTAAIAVMVGFGISVQQVIDRNNKMADAMSGVEKNVNMTRQEVEQLNRAFADFDTRTKRIDLLKIAEEGGKLGVGKDQITDFVREVDKAVVALGDSWEGGADKIANSIGKITTLYSQTRNEPIAEAINDIGSALNELAADGAASEANIADFTTRVGALPEKLKPAIADALGLGAAFEESGIDAQRSGTAFTTFVSTAANGAEAFAKVMRIPVEQVKEMINTDPTEFFLKFSEGLRGMDATDLAATLEYLKINDQYVKSIVGAASDNTERFRKTLDLANKSIKEGTSLQNEFNKVNNNAAAIWEKTQKKVAALFTSAVVSKFIAGTVEAFGKFIGAIEDSDGYITGFRNNLMILVKILAVVMATMISYNLVTGVYNTLLKTAAERVIGLTIVEKARNLVTAAGTALNTVYTAGLGLMGAGYALVTGNIAQATFAMRGFTAAIAANPLGALLVLVTAVASAFFILRDSTDESTKKLKEQNKELDLNGQITKRVTDEHAKSVGELRSKVEPLIKVLKDENSQLKQRKEAYQELIKISPEFNGTLDKELRATERLDRAYASLIEKIKAASQARALQSLLDEQYEKREKLTTRGEMFQASVDAAGPSGLNPDGTPKAGLQVVKNIVQDTNAEVEQLDKNIDQLSTKIANLKPQGGSDYFVPQGTETKEKSTTAGENRYKKELDDMLRRGDAAAQLARQIQLDIEDARIEAMEEGYEKEKAQMDLLEQRRMAEIDKKMITDNEFKKLDEKIKTAKAGDKVLFQALKQSWIKNNTELENLKTQEQSNFRIKQQTLRAQHDIKDVQEENKLHDQKIALLKRQQNEELASWDNLEQMKQGLRAYYSDEELRRITTWEQGKEALNKVYQKRELEMQAAHLQMMVDLYEGLDMGILTPEQQKQVLAFIEEAKNKMAEFKAVAKSTENEEPKDKKGKLGNKGSTDILGMSLEDWDVFFSNIQTGVDKLGTLQAAVGALQNAFGMYYQFVQAQEQAQIRQIEVNSDRRHRRLKNMLDSGLINQEQYEQSVQELQEETEKKKAKLEYEAAVRQKNFQIAQIIANTAQAIMSIWAQVPKFDFGATAGIMTGIVSALGALQLATVVNTPLPEAPGYEDGFGMNYDMRRQQDGKKFNVVRKPLRSGEVYRPTHFIAGEKGVEMVIDSPTYTRFRPEVKKILHNEIAYARGFEGGYYPYLSGGNSGSGNEALYADTIERNTVAINALLKKEFRAYIPKNMDNAKNAIEMIEEYETYKKSSEK